MASDNGTKDTVTDEASTPDDPAPGGRDLDDGLNPTWEGGTDAAIRKAIAASEEDPTDAEPLEYLGRIMCHNRRYTEAEDYLTRALELTPGSGAVLFHLANVVSYQGRRKEALDILEKAAALDPLDAGSMWYFAAARLGEICVELGDRDRAREALEHARSKLTEGADQEAKRRLDALAEQIERDY